MEAHPIATPQMRPTALKLTHLVLTPQMRSDILTGLDRSRDYCRRQAIDNDRVDWRIKYRAQAERIGVLMEYVQSDYHTPQRQMLWGDIDF